MVQYTTRKLILLIIDHPGAGRGNIPGQIDLMQKISVWEKRLHRCEKLLYWKLQSGRGEGSLLFKKNTKRDFLCGAYVHHVPEYRLGMSDTGY